MQLEVLVIGDAATLPPQEGAAHEGNLASLGDVLARVPGGLRYCARIGDVAGMFPAVYKEGNASYRGPFEMVARHINVSLGVWGWVGLGLGVEVGVWGYWSSRD